MSRINAVILDVDGTVATCPYDFPAMRSAVARAAANWGLDITCLAARGIIEQMQAAAGKLGEQGPAFRREAESAVVALEVAAARTAELLPGSGVALSQLRQAGMGIALITRNCRAAAEIVLDGLRDYDVLLTRDDVPRPKPDPDHVTRSLAALGSTRERAVVVGDHRYDMEAGRAAGVRLCVGVRTGSSSDASLTEGGADAVIDSLADLPEWLRTFEESAS